MSIHWSPSQALTEIDRRWIDGTVRSIVVNTYSSVDQKAGPISINCKEVSLQVITLLRKRAKEGLVRCEEDILRGTAELARALACRNARRSLATGLPRLTSASEIYAELPDEERARRRQDLALLSVLGLIINLRDREIVRLRAAEHKSFRQIAANIGSSKTRVEVRFKQIVGELDDDTKGLTAEEAGLPLTALLAALLDWLDNDNAPHEEGETDLSDDHAEHLQEGTRVDVNAVARSPGVPTNSRGRTWLAIVGALLALLVMLAEGSFDTPSVPQGNTSRRVARKTAGPPARGPAWRTVVSLSAKDASANHASVGEVAITINQLAVSNMPPGQVDLGQPTDVRRATVLQTLIMNTGPDYVANVEQTFQIDDYANCGTNPPEVRLLADRPSSQKPVAPGGMATLEMILGRDGKTDHNCQVRAQVVAKWIDVKGIRHESGQKLLLVFPGPIITIASPKYYPIASAGLVEVVLTGTNRGDRQGRVTVEASWEKPGLSCADGKQTCAWEIPAGQTRAYTFTARAPVKNVPEPQLTLNSDSEGFPQVMPLLPWSVDQCGVTANVLGYYRCGEQVGVLPERRTFPPVGLTYRSDKEPDTDQSSQAPTRWILSFYLPATNRVWTVDMRRLKAKDGRMLFAVADDIPGGNGHLSLCVAQVMLEQSSFSAILDRLILDGRGSIKSANPWLAGSCPLWLLNDERSQQCGLTAKFGQGEMRAGVVPLSPTNAQESGIIAGIESAANGQTGPHSWSGQFRVTGKVSGQTESSQYVGRWDLVEFCGENEQRSPCDSSGKQFWGCSSDSCEHLPFAPM